MTVGDALDWNRVNGGYEDGRTIHSDWDRWLSEHAPKFLLFARQQVRFEADAQDLVQDSVVECWRRQAQGAPPAAGQVFATIRRRAIDQSRSANRRAGREAVVAQEAPAEWFDPTIEDRERNLKIQAAMSQMSELYREVVTLKVWGELTFAEIATVLEIPQNTAASRYRYGLAELRKLTQAEFND